MPNDRKVYRFSRGEKFECLVSIDESGLCVFDNIKYPPKTSEAIVERFISDAEREVIKVENAARYWSEDA